LGVGGVGGGGWGERRAQNTREVCVAEQVGGLLLVLGL
jgi:hypothetical protein